MKPQLSHNEMPDWMKAAIAEVVGNWGAYRSMTDNIYPPPGFRLVWFTPNPDIGIGKVGVLVPLPPPAGEPTEA